MKLSERKKLIIFKALLFLFAFIIAFMPSTVSRNKEVNSRVIVEMIGLDEAEGEVEVTAQYVMPTQTDGSTSKDKVNVKGKTVTEAVEALSVALGRRAELGHCSMLIIGGGVKPDTLASLMTGTDVTADVYMSAAEGKAGELVGDITDFLKKSNATDADLISYSAKKSHVATTTLLNFLSDIGSASHTAYVPVVEMIKQSAQSGGEQGGQGGQDGQSGQGEQEGPSGMKTEKLALYGKEGRIGVLDSDAARGVAWVSAHVEKSIVSGDIEYGGKEYKGVSGRLVSKSSKIKIDNDKKTATIKVKAKLAPRCDKFNEINTSVADARAAIRDGFASAIEKEIKAGYYRSLELGADPMFIVRQFYRYAPRSVENGLSLGDIDVRFEVEADIK